MDKLPSTFQGMKDYARFAKKTIKREEKRIEELKEALYILEPKIKNIESQLNEISPKK